MNKTGRRELQKSTPSTQIVRLALRASLRKIINHSSVLSTFPKWASEKCGNHVIANQQVYVCTCVFPTRQIGVRRWISSIRTFWLPSRFENLCEENQKH